MITINWEKREYSHLIQEPYHNVHIYAVPFEGEYEPNEARKVLFAIVRNVPGLSYDVKGVDSRTGKLVIGESFSIGD